MTKIVCPFALLFFLWLTSDQGFRGQILDRRPYGTLLKSPYASYPYHSRPHEHIDKSRRMKRFPLGFDNEERPGTIVVQKGFEPAVKGTGHPRRQHRMTRTMIVLRQRKPITLGESREIPVDDVRLKQTIEEDSRQRAIAQVELEVNAPKARTPECLLSPDAGTGGFVLPMVYFNPTTFTCEYFTYTGLGGNGNRFDNMLQCYTVCDPSEDKEGEDVKESMSGKKKKKFVKGDSAGSTETSRATGSGGTTGSGESTTPASASTAPSPKAGKQGWYSPDDPSDYEYVTEYIDV